MELLINELQQMNIQYAIKGEVKTKLVEILPLLTKDKLNLLAGNYEIKGRSKLKKQELADAIQASITDVQELNLALLMATSNEWELVQKLLAVPYLQDDAMPPGSTFFLINTGLLYSFYDQDKLYYVLPEEVKETYAKVAGGELLQERERVQQVGSYILAAMNLYGVCPFDQFLAIYNAQNEDRLDEAVLSRICHLLTRREQSWHVADGRLVADYYDNDNQDELTELLASVAGKPYYIPDRKEFLQYAEYGYYEETPQLAGLEQYILEYLSRDKELVHDLISEIQFECSMSKPIEEIMMGFEDRGIEISTREQLEMVIHLVINVYNNTRMWSNAGFKPVELGASGSGAATDPLRNLVPSKQQAVSAKIGRNEPCPCGSGKKYKKCCG
ncbi:SEC-C metal-binding domain-containing protein [Paenibacillus glycanilyticus]|uniref:YecA family protein n=1 Tax=Paenibacillus glycanilyticus TaxID=126569 RepID=UPI00203EE8C1|nr:SEC-C metal-binding domain-containing protein [Paenibacillus glycanilyticus]MCM3631255.1 SEC-C metal-binding domain-containing protein [Paenibacillus glycanilyticus]